MRKVLKELKQESKTEMEARIAHEKAIEKIITDLQLAHERKLDRLVTLVESKHKEQKVWNKKQDEKVDALAGGVEALRNKFDEVLSTFNGFRAEAQEATAAAAACTAASASFGAAAPGQQASGSAAPSTEPRADPGLIKIGASRATTRQAVQNAFFPHILDIFGLIENEFRILGPAAGKNFEVHFKTNQ